jgi:hypothetical protein
MNDDVLTAHFGLQRRSRCLIRRLHGSSLRFTFPRVVLQLLIELFFLSDQLDSRPAQQPLRRHGLP